MTPAAKQKAINGRTLVNRREFALGLVALPALSRTASAEVSSIKLGKQYGLPFLPQMVMEDHRLIETHAARLGVKDLSVGWQTMGGPGALNDGLLSGQIHFVNVASPSLATLWDKTFGTPNEVRAVCTVQSMPYVLTTRNAAVKTIADFTAADRIAVPTVKISGQAMALQMAAAKLWGFEKYDKLDEFTVTMGHPDAMQSMLSGQTVNSHFAVAPFNYYELKVPGIHTVLNSYATDGKHTNGIQVTTKAFHDANPLICKAVRASHEEANAFIKREPKAAAEIYLKLTNDKKNSAADLMAMITDPDIDYTTAPANLMKHVEFMHKVGRMKHVPSSWKDLFFAEAHDLKGS
jgi:NitT/TauT family transport system substrate-binding protein